LTVTCTPVDPQDPKAVRVAGAVNGVSQLGALVSGPLAQPKHYEELLVVDATTGLRAPAGSVCFTVADAGSMRWSCPPQVRVEALPSARLLQRAPAAAPQVGAIEARASGAVPAIVTDTLQLLAEIAYERAKSQAYGVLYDSAEKLVCEDAVLAEDVEIKVVTDGGDWTVTLPKGELLGQTCETLQAAGSFTALVNASVKLVGALETDLASFATRTVLAAVIDGQLGAGKPVTPWAKAALKYVGTEVAAVLWGHLLDGTGLDATDAGVLLARLHAYDWGGVNGGQKPTTDQESALAYGLALGFTVAAECAVATDGVACKPAGVVDRLTHPPYTDLPPAPTGAAKVLYDAFVPRLATLITRIESAQSARAGTSAERAQVAINLTFDILDLLVTVGGFTDAVASETFRPFGARELNTLLVPLRSMLLDLAADDPLGATTEALGLLRDLLSGAPALEPIVAALHTSAPAEAKASFGEALTAVRNGDLKTAKKKAEEGFKKAKTSKTGPADPVAWKKVKAQWQAAMNLDPLLNGISRVTPLVSVLASNADNLEKAQANPEDAEALRTARKEALEAVIDATTQRDGRGGDVVVSLGANVALVPFRMSVSREVGTDKTTHPLLFDVVATTCEAGAECIGVGSGELSIPLALPMGLAVQKLPQLAGDGRHYKPGSYLQLSPVDLGLFLPEATYGTNAEDLQWSDFLMLGVGGGVLLGRPQNLFSVGLDVRMAPYSEEKPWQFAVTAGYYLPFLDLN
jgi:hypothetical protein